MKIIAQCPQCGFTWLLDEAAADRRIRCKHCQKTFEVPRVEEVPKAASVIKDAKAALYVDESGKLFG